MAVGITVGLLGTRLLSAQQQAPVQLRPLPLKHTQLYKTDLAGLEGKQGVLIAVEYAPGAADEKHYHPGQLFTYVLEGSVIWEVESQPPITLKAGDFYDPPKRVHNHKNASATAPAKFLVFFVEEKGQPRSVPVK